MADPLHFILAGCHGGDPISDLPEFPGRWRWYVDRWTGPMPSNEALSEAVGRPVRDWPLAFDDQMALALEAPTVLLVCGDPLVATPHHLLVLRIKAKGKRVLVRRRLGVAELAAPFAGCKPRVLPASARVAIEEHLGYRVQPLLVVRDDEEQSLDLAPHPAWTQRWLIDIGSATERTSDSCPGDDALTCLLWTRRSANEDE